MSSERSRAVDAVLVLLFVVLCFFRRGDLFMSYLVLFCYYDFRLFGFVCFLFLLVSGKGCDL